MESDAAAAAGHSQKSSLLSEGSARGQTGSSGLSRHYATERERERER